MENTIMESVNNLTYATVFYIAAMFADIVTSEKAFERGAYEKSYLLAPVISKIGRFWILVKLAVTGAAAAMAYFSNAVWAMWVIAAITAFFAIRNHNVAR